MTGMTEMATSARLYLTERWSISRGRDTYGYNICTIEVSDHFGAGQDLRHTRGQCKGGGYDMAGTSLALCLTQIPGIQTRLSALSDDALSNLYGAYRCADGTVHIDGRCGQSSVIAAMKYINVEVRPNYRRHRGRDTRIGWFVEVQEWN